MNFLLSAGEASGDTYGAQLIEALCGLAPSSTFFGMGGEKMRDSGAELLIHANEVAVVGLVEVVKHLPDIRRRFKHLVAEATRRKPNAAILIDFPDFNLRLARELHRLGVPVFYFVSPQIWAWRTGRVKQIKKYVRKMIVIFPFEQEFMRGTESRSAMWGIRWRMCRSRRSRGKSLRGIIGSIRESSGSRYCRVAARKKSA